jgi:hypothetical protein
VKVNRHASGTIYCSCVLRLADARGIDTRINDAAFAAGIDSNRTPELLKKSPALFSTELATIDVLQRVVRMSPENIQLNSFMHEPILDISDGNLRKLYGEVVAPARTRGGESLTHRSTAG